MRKRRAIIYDDEPVVLFVLKDFFEGRGYDVLACREPVVCPIYGDGAECASRHACGDIMVTDYKMPRMNGIELLQAQARKGCKVMPGNKALLSGYLDDDKIASIQDLGSAFFEKPVEFEELGRWVDACEQRMDLSLPLGILRKEERRGCSQAISYQLSSSDGRLKGIVVNMSTSGLCLQVSAPLARDQRVTIETSLPIASPVASVRWFREIGDGAYLAGLQCS